jgi:hypothetical protein
MDDMDNMDEMDNVDEVDGVDNCARAAATPEFLPLDPIPDYLLMGSLAPSKTLVTVPWPTP